MQYWKTDLLVPEPFYNVDFPGQFYKNWLFQYKLTIGLICTLIISLIPLIGLFGSERRKEKAILSALKSHFISCYLGDSENNRITLFKMKYGFQIYIAFFWKCIVKNGVPHIKKGLFFYYLSQFPIPYKKYLVQHSRSGQPHPNGSSTFFPVPNDEDDVVGIVGEAYLKEKPKKLTLPRIDRKLIKNKKDIKNCPRNIRKDVESYMKKGQISSFKKLQSLHRLPTSLYADPIMFDGKKWGCLVFDSEDDNIEFEKSYLEFINYSKVILAVVSNLNSK